MREYQHCTAVACCAVLGLSRACCLIACVSADIAPFLAQLSWMMPVLACLCVREYYTVKYYARFPHGDSARIVDNAYLLVTTYLYFYARCAQYIRILTEEAPQAGLGDMRFCFLWGVT